MAAKKMQLDSGRCCDNTTRRLVSSPLPAILATRSAVTTHFVTVVAAIITAIAQRSSIIIKTGPALTHPKPLSYIY